MYDNDLFEHATQMFDGLAEGGAPFLLTLLTLDTHHPTGTPSPVCQPYPAGTEIEAGAVEMLNAVHCSDQLVKDFVEHVRGSSVGGDTVVAIMSDHLLIHGDVEEMLDTRERRPLFFLLDPSRRAETRDGPAAHFDVAPTLLEAVGLKDARFAFGRSLLSHPTGLAEARDLAEEDFLPFTVEALTDAVATESP